MSVLSRVSAPAAAHDLAGVVVALFANPERTAPRDLPESTGDQLPTADHLPGDDNQPTVSVVGRLLAGPTGLGTSAARIPWQRSTPGEPIAATGQVSGGASAEAESGTELYCPPAVRDDVALG